MLRKIAYRLIIAYSKADYALRDVVECSLHLCIAGYTVDLPANSDTTVAAGA